MGTISSLSKLLGLPSKLKAVKCSLDTVEHDDPTSIVEHLDFQYFPETISIAFSPRLDSSPTAGLGEVVQYNGYGNRAISFTAVFTDNMRVGFNDDGSDADDRTTSQKVLDQLKKGPSGFAGDTVKSLVGGKEVPNLKRVNLAATKAFIEGLTYPDELDGTLISSPNLIFNLPNSGIVSTPIEKGAWDLSTGKIYGKIESLSVDIEKFYEDGKMMIFSAQISIKEVFNLGLDDWTFLTRKHFESVYGDETFNVQNQDYGAKNLFSNKVSKNLSDKKNKLQDNLANNKNLISITGDFGGNIA